MIPMFTGTHATRLEPLGRASQFAYELAEVLRATPLFSAFTLQDCGILGDYMNCFAAARDATLVSQSRPGEFFVIVLTGAVDIIRAGPEGMPQLLGHCGPGSVAGEAGFVDGGLHDVSCVATEPTDFAILTRASLCAVANEHPHVAFKLLSSLVHLLAQRLREFTGPSVPGAAPATATG